MGMLVRLFLFASSFSIALLLIAVRLWDPHRDLAYIAAVTAVVLLLPAVLVHWYASKGSSFSGVVTDFDPRGEAVAGYLFGYLLPVTLLDPSDSSDVIVIGAFVIFLSIVYAAADLHYLNPLLPLVGVRVWQVTVEAPDRCHKFMAIGGLRSLELGQGIAVIGSGAVRLIRSERGAR